MAAETFDILLGDVPTFRKWYRESGGVLRWANHEIASSHARYVFTRKGAGQPGWRYFEPEELQPEQLRVESREVLYAFRGRFKAHYYGPGVAQATERKAERIKGELIRDHGPDVYWSWEHDEPGYVMVRLWKPTYAPFALEEVESDDSALRS